MSYVPSVPSVANPLFETPEAVLTEVGDALVGWGMYPHAERGSAGVVRDALTDAFAARVPGAVCDGYPMGADVRSGRLLIRTAVRNRGRLTGWAPSFWRGMPLHGGAALIQILGPGEKPEEPGVPTRVLQWERRGGMWRISRPAGPDTSEG